MQLCPWSRLLYTCPSKKLQAFINKNGYWLQRTAFPGAIYGVYSRRQVGVMLYDHLISTDAIAVVLASNFARLTRNSSVLNNIAAVYSYPPDSGIH